MEQTQKMAQKAVQQPRSQTITDSVLDVQPLPILFREVESKKLLDILSKGIKNNAVIVGDSGVGKTAFVRGNIDNISEKLGMGLIELNPHGIFNRIQSKAHFDDQVLNIFNNIYTNKNLVLYIDNFDLFIKEYKGNEFDFDLMLSMFLEKNAFPSILNITKSEYENFKNSYISKFFEPIFLDALDNDKIFDIIKFNKWEIEEYYNIKINDSLIRKLISLNERFITQPMPLSCFNVLESAASHLNNKRVYTPSKVEIEQIESIRSQIEMYNELKNESVTKKEFNLSAMYKDKVKEAEGDLIILLSKIKSTEKRSVLKEEHIRNVISDITKIPINKLTTDNLQKLRTLDVELKTKVVNQDKAIDTLTRSIKRNSVGIRDHKKPVGVFLFVGPTGTGKTYLTKVLSNTYYNSEKDIIRLDMSEYSDKISINKLLGSSPGYVGYDEGGILTRAVNEKPYSIILLDEIEKAHPLVFNTLLQVFDEGHMSDNKGRTISFKNNIIIMTSNVGCHSATQKVKINKVGFNKSLNVLEKVSDFENAINDEIKSIFPPEFINRIDEIITFNKLEGTHLAQIIKLELEKITERLKVNDYNIIFEEGIETSIFKDYESKINLDYGAREVKRCLLSFEDFITDSIINNTIKKGTIKIGYDNGYLIR
jgi:ATP-dependent Clp protease ATP-binding subunit ClpC